MTEAARVARATYVLASPCRSLPHEKFLQLVTHMPTSPCTPAYTLTNIGDRMGRLMPSFRKFWLGIEKKVVEEGKGRSCSLIGLKRAAKTC
jgi:hypothetical protein